MQIRHILIKDHISIFSSETAEPNYTKPGREGSWVGPFPNCVRQPRSPFKMAAVTENRNFFNCLLKQQWTIEEISIFSNSSHLEWRAGLSDTIYKGTHPRTSPLLL
jgi:hypothetical protein